MVRIHPPLPIEEIMQVSYFLTGYEHIRDKNNPSDLTNYEWFVVKNRFLSNRYRDLPDKYDKRILIDSVLYVMNTGCLWSDLPECYLPWKIVYSWYRKGGGKIIFKRLLNNEHNGAYVWGNEPDPDCCPILYKLCKHKRFYL